MVYKIKRSLQFIALSLFFILSVSLLPYSSAHAEILSDEESGLHTFAVPDGSWNTARVLLRYEEDYQPLSSFPRNAFSWREQTYYHRFTGMSAGNIKLDVSNFLHTDGTNRKIIYPTGSTPTIFDPTVWDMCEVDYNSDTYEYTNTTNYYGQVTYMVACTDGIPAECFGSVQLSFKTQ